MKIIKTSFKGLKIIKLKKHSDKRGNLVETFRENKIKGKKLIFLIIEYFLKKIY